MFSDIDMKKFCLLMTSVIANLLFMACSRNDNKTNDIYTNKADEALHLDTVRNIPLKREILLNGKVDFDMENMTPVFPMISGIVKEVYGETGDYVGKGERLALIESEDIASIVKEMKTAEHKLKLAERNYKAAEDMLRGGLSSEREVLNYRQELTEAEEELNRLNKLKAIYPIDENGLYILCSPVSGFITERNINRNYLIRPDSDKELFTIAGLNEVWIIADVYERDINKIREKQSVRITTLAYPEIEFKGEIDKVYHILNSESKTMNVRIKLSNKDYLLKPGMFANVYVCRDNESHLFPTVPYNAVIFENGRQYVVIKDNEGKLSKKEVKVYKQDNEYCYIEDGLKAGDVIVGKNALLVYSSLEK